MIIKINEGSHSGIDRATGVRYVVKANISPVTVSDEEGEYLLKSFPKKFKPGISLKTYKNTRTFTDIIVPTYKNEEYTIKCFESIKRCTKPGTYKIFWVDDGSGKSSRDKVSRTLRDINHKKIFLNENVGFIKATNAGLKASKAPTICFLNNDTIVTPNWLSKLTKTLLSNNIGIIGAMSQIQGSLPEEAIQQSITQLWHQVEFPVYDYDLDKYNLALEKKFNGRYVPAPKFVAFYCAVLRRQVINEVGFLNEEFGIGLYDDVDYCEEAIKKGFGLAVALDTMIYHKSNATFEKYVDDKEFKQAHAKNFKIYQKNKANR